MNIIKEDNDKNIQMGQYGTLYFTTNYTDTENIFNISDIEEKTKFEAFVVDDKNNKYQTVCRLWKPENEKIRIICNLDVNMKNHVQNIKLNDKIFEYEHYDIEIYSETFIIVEQYDYKIPFLYSDKQIINLDNNKEIYDLKFKIDSFDDDSLYLQGIKSNYAILDNYEINNKELICHIEKETLESIISNKNEIFKLRTINDNIGIITFNLVLNIIINPLDTTKEDIYLEIKDLLEETIEAGSSFAFTTNITQISILNSYSFNLSFSTADKKCYFKKAIIGNLMLICESNKEEIIYLNTIDKEIQLNDIHYKYNFRIQPGKISSKITIEKYGTQIDFVSPEIFNLTSISINDTLIIRYIMSSPTDSINIKLNPDSSDNLNCENLLGMKKCFIPLNHFLDKETGYYYTYHSNHLNKYSIYYDANPIKIILPEKIIKLDIEDKYNNIPINIGQKGVIYLITNYNDTDENIFDADDIEEKTKFITDFYDTKDHKANCRLWKPKNDNIRIICELEDNFRIKNGQNIYINMKDAKFRYNNITISIKSKMENIVINQLISDFSFLYSDKQIIDMDNKTDIYYLNFIKGNYDNMSLYLYKNKLQSVKLNCTEEDNEIKCNVSKNEILEILAYNGEKYYLAEMTDSEGLNIINAVMDIIINYNIDKIDININTIKLLTLIGNKNEFIAYETNVDNVDEMVSYYFKISSDKINDIDCIFKKNKFEKLLILCNSSTAGVNSMGTLKSKTITDANIKYNINIEEIKNDEEFNITNDDGDKIYSIYPQKLDFTKKDYYIVKFETEYPERINNIKLTENSKALECINKIKYKECNITSDYFTDGGYYHTYHINKEGVSYIKYEASIIEVILNEKKKEEEDDDAWIIALCIVGGVILICAIILLIYYFVRKKQKNKKKKEVINNDSQPPNDLAVPISPKVIDEIKKSEFKEERINN